MRASLHCSGSNELEQQWRARRSHVCSPLRAISHCNPKTLTLFLPARTPFLDHVIGVLSCCFPSSASSIADGVVKNRWLEFLIWQSIASTAVHIPSSFLLHHLGGPASSAVALLFSFLAFHLSLLLLSLSFFLLFSPDPDSAASLSDLATVALRVSFKSLISRIGKSLSAHVTYPGCAERRKRGGNSGLLFPVAEHALSALVDGRSSPA